MRYPVSGTLYFFPLYIQWTYTARMDAPTLDVQEVQSPDVADPSTWKVTKHRSIRLEDDLWRDLEPAAKGAGYDRSGVIRQFVRWYLRVPGAKLPQRPGK